MRYIVVNVGCIECGVSSNIVGVYSDKEKAEEIENKLNESEGASWRNSGQNSYKAFEMPKINVTNPEYLEWLE